MAAPPIRPADVLFIRNRLDITQEQLAERVGVQRTAVCHWEKGLRKPTGPVRILLGKLREAAEKRVGK